MQNPPSPKPKKKNPIDLECREVVVIEKGLQAASRLPNKSGHHMTEATVSQQVAYHSLMHLSAEEAGHS